MKIKKSKRRNSQLKLESQVFSREKKVHKTKSSNNLMDEISSHSKARHKLNAFTRRVQARHEVKGNELNQEQEAHVAARAVVTGQKPVAIKGNGPSGVIRRRMQAEPTNSRGPLNVDLSSTLDRNHGGGRSLNFGERSFFESRFRRNFGAVRVHTGTNAQEMAEAMGARAFTLGQDIYFNQNQYQPDSHEGRELLAHELTHTIQQRGKKNHVQKSSLFEPEENTQTMPSPRWIGIHSKRGKAFTITKQIQQDLNTGEKYETGRYGLCREVAQSDIIDFSNGKMLYIPNGSWIKASFPRGAMNVLRGPLLIGSGLNLDLDMDDLSLSNNFETENREKKPGKKKKNKKSKKPKKPKKNKGRPKGKKK